jgi:hypothetical protein
MRRIGRTPLVAIAATLLVASAVQAQTGTPDYGITAGLNLSTISGGTPSNTEKRSYRYDFMAGVSAIFPLSDMVALQPELVYSRQGVKVTDSGAEGTIKISYVTIPVLLRFSLADAKSEMKPALYVGPYVAMKAGCSAEFKVGTLTDSGDCSSANIDSPVKSVDFGATLGGELGFGALGVFARYSMGLTSIDNSKTGAQDIKNRVITIGGRWSFRSK